MQLTRRARPSPSRPIAKAGAGLARGICRAGSEPVEIAAHELRDPAFRHVAGEGHRARLAVDRKNGAHHVVVGLGGSRISSGKSRAVPGRPRASSSPR